ncbi:MAG TPA: hypothetical protein VHK67_06280, partial [Rhabdochlamydiaceae bacterium]|nr:hypothetical protein [Rhabdochlamydiaceae bacterium]
MTHLMPIERRACIALLIHIKNSWGWSQTDSHLWQFFNTAIVSIQAYNSLSYLSPLRIAKHPIGFLAAPCALGAVSLGIYVPGLYRGHPHPRLEASRLYAPYERLLQVVNLVCCIFFFQVSDSSILWKIGALLLQVIDLTHSFYCGTMHQRIQEATKFVRGRIHGDKNPKPSNVRPYYHLLAIANAHISDVYGSEFRSNLISMIQKADKNPTYAQKLINWTFILEKEKDGEKIKKEMSMATLEFGNRRQNTPRLNLIGIGSWDHS